ncbi:hypothetical protein PAMP_024310 [Pampus punctatissimus]
MAEQPLTDWKSGLCDCFEDASTCCYGFWCCPCLACTVAGRFGENRCLPLCDICSPAAMTACGIPLFVPPAALAIRVGIRNRYGVKMHRELKHHMKKPTVINMQPQIVQMQPAPVVMAPVNMPTIGFVNQPGVVMAHY